MKLKTPEAVFRFIEPDIVLASFAHGTRVDLEMARQIVAQRLQLTNNKKHYLVADASNVLSITAEAKKFLQKPDNGLKNISGAALIASNPLSALIANIFIKTPADFITQFFSNERDALNWIRIQKTKAQF
jgi:hypothetical protein